MASLFPCSLTPIPSSWDFPINQALFGDASIPYVLIYYMCNTTFFWTLGTYLIQRDGEGEAQFDLKTSLKKVFSPPLMGFILGTSLGDAADQAASIF